MKFPCKNEKRIPVFMYVTRQEERLFDFVADELIRNKKTHKQIAQALDRPVSTIKRWLSNSNGMTFERAAELIYGISDGKPISFNFDELQYHLNEVHPHEIPTNPVNIFYAPNLPTLDFVPQGYGNE